MISDKLNREIDEYAMTTALNQFGGPYRDPDDLNARRVKMITFDFCEWLESQGWKIVERGRRMSEEYEELATAWRDTNGLCGYEIPHLCDLLRAYDERRAQEVCEWKVMERDGDGKPLSFKSACGEWWHTREDETSCHDICCPRCGKPIKEVSVSIFRGKRAIAAARSIVSTRRSEMDDNKRIELEALITEREGMIAENAYRARIGYADSYGEDAFLALAAKMRALSANRLDRNRRILRHTH